MKPVKFTAQNSRAGQINHFARSMEDWDKSLGSLMKTYAMIEFLPDGTIVAANQEFLAVMGYEIGQILGRHHRIFVPMEFARSVEYREFWPKLAAGEARSGIFARLAKGGRPIWIEGTDLPLRNETGQVVSVLKLLRDVTAEVLKDGGGKGNFSAREKVQAVFEFTPTGLIALRSGGHAPECVRSRSF